MKSRNSSHQFDAYLMHHSELSDSDNHLKLQQNFRQEVFIDSAEILVITSYPPRECGIATYSQDLIKTLNHQFSKSLTINVCALESGSTNFSYPDEVKYVLNTSLPGDYKRMTQLINHDFGIQIVLVQHEFGLFSEQEQSFLKFLTELTKPVILAFHTVLPQPDMHLKLKVQHIIGVSRSVIVMTHNSADILMNEYGVPEQKIAVIAHGTHLVLHADEKSLKSKFGLNDRKVITTFGLLSSGKGIETTLDAMPAIIAQCPEVIFLVIGRTHPGVIKAEGEKYRGMLEAKIKQNHIQNHVRFINKYLDLPELLEYLQLTDIYLFTSTDPNQAVSGTFAYAMSCSCPIISTPIPHAKELLTEDTGIIFDFRNSEKLAEAVVRLTQDDELRRKISFNALQKIVSSAWENSAVAHAKVFEKVTDKKITSRYNLPAIKLDHLTQLTTDIGIVQFSRVNQPDVSTGYTLDDNARGLVSMCMYFKETGDRESLFLIQKYLSFIHYCQQSGGGFLNYVGDDYKFTDQNKIVNLDDSNGRAIWALGYLTSLINVLPAKFTIMADRILGKSLHSLTTVHSTRAMAFVIKGMYYHHQTLRSSESIGLFKTFADRLVRMYKHESDGEWEWFEGYLTYENSIIPEAMLYAWLLTGNKNYKEIAVSSLNFLIRHTFNNNEIEVISNKKWLLKDWMKGRFGEQPIDVADTVMTMSLFYDVTEDEQYLRKMKTAFNWFLGNNRLHQTVYNPCTGGCYDGLEEINVNLNQGAESTLSFLMARLTMEKYSHCNELNKFGCNETLYKI